jgi:hypothetical protein
MSQKIRATGHEPRELSPREIFGFGVSPMSWHSRDEIAGTRIVRDGDAIVQFDQNIAKRTTANPNFLSTSVKMPSLMNGVHE